MKVIVGLGNPGIKYANNRHNVGHMVVDAMKVRPLKSASKGLTFVKTDKFMNDSGSFVLAQYTKYLPRRQAGHIPYTSLFIVHDDLDIKLGEYKIQFGKGPKEHKGLKSVDKELKTDQYWHVRVGIENRSQNLESRIKGEEYVLQDFTEEEKIVLNRVIKQICKKLVAL